MVSPKLAAKALNVKKAQPKQALASTKKNLTKQLALKAKMQAILAAQKKKKSAAKPIGLAQTSSRSEVESFAKALT